MPKIGNILSSLMRSNERLLRVTVRGWMDYMQKQVRRDLSERYQKSAASVGQATVNLTDWELVQSEGIRTIKPAALEIMQTSGNAAYRHLAVAGSFDVINVQAVRAVDKFCSKLVVGVTAKTKEGINTYVKYGIKEGHSMPKIARELRPLVGLTSNQIQSIINYRTLLTEKHPGYSAARIDKAVMRYTNKTHRMRMENIARTETARAQNIGYCQGLEQVGVKEVELSNADDPCEICAGLNGTRYKVGEGSGVIPVHPRCRCVMLPVVDNKAISEQLKKPHPKLRKFGVL